MFSTSDAGESWEKAKVDFILSGKLKFSARDPDSDNILTLEKRTQTLYVSEDGGKNWRLALHDVYDFTWSGFSVDDPETIYALHGKTSGKSKTDKDVLTLSKSVNCGRSWKPILSKVRKMWVPESMQNDEFAAPGQEGQPKLGRFLYAMHFDEDESKVQLSVSDDGGLSFKRVYLPTVAPERFFNVLEVEEDFVFLHVDEPDDTGYGTLYVSDSTGTVFSESLRRHLYPNHSPVTDFFRVASMRGTFLATQLNPDSTLRTVITHDRGATWKPLPIPEGMELQCGGGGNQSSTGASSDPAGEDANSQRFRSPTLPVFSSSSPDATLAQNGTSAATIKDASPGYKKVCGLQISNQFSMRSRVVASPPLATSTARGLILAHGHVSTHLKNTPADGYVSSDGGYTWRKAFDGPHHYQIANRGGLIVAVPADTLWVDVLRFSTDEGRCWHTIPLTYAREKSTTPTKTTVSVPLTSQRQPEQGDSNTPNDTAAADIGTPAPTRIPSESDETVVFTGLVTEPGGQAMTVAVYGYGTVSQRWRVAVVDFSTNGIISRNCTAEDYEVWSPHEIPAKGDAPDNGCLLGMKEFFYRLKEDALCFTDANFHSLISSETCECTEADYECEYGFWRQMGSTECVPNPHAPDLDVCELTEDDRDRLHELGYRRIPGDRCTGGWEPPRRNQTITRKLLNCPSKLDTYLSVGSKVVGIFVALTVAVLFILFLLRWRFQDCHTRRHTSICPIDCKRLMRWPRKANVFHHISNGDGLANEGIATISFSRPPTATFVDMDSTFTEASVRASPKPGMMTSVLQQMSLRSKRKAEDKRSLLGEENMPGMLTPPEENEGPF